MRLVGLLICLALAACGRSVPPGARIVVAGDSVMAWNRNSGGSVADNMSALLREPVGDVATSLARVTEGVGPLSIPSQVARLSAEWVILDGGANDLREECGCTRCDTVLDELVSEDGRSGAVPRLVDGLRGRGSKVIWADYYTAPRYAGTICVGPYLEYEARLMRMAARDEGVVLVDLAAVMPSADLSLFAWDKIHPSPTGSARIARLLADTLQAERAKRGGGR